VVLLTLTACAAEPPPAGAPRGLEGSWKMTGRLDGGQREAAPGEITWTFKAGKLTLSFQGKSQQGSYVADAAKKPAWIDLSLPAGPGQPVIPRVGIFEIQGETLRIAMPDARREKRRPSGFDDATLRLEVFKFQAVK